MKKIYLSSIVAMADSHVIGKDNALPWHISEDLKHFKRTTLGKPMVMGRKCYESLGKPLPGRPNIVVSRSQTSLPENARGDYAKMESVDINGDANIDPGPYLYNDLQAGIEAGQDMATNLGADEVMIVGGGEIYKQTMDEIDRLYLTLIHRDYEGDTFFPQFDWEDWKITSEDRHDGDPAFTFYVLERP